MITEDALLQLVAGLDRVRLKRWIAEAWVRPEEHEGKFLFREIDLARVRLIFELNTELGIDEEAIPVVLQLLDHIHTLRHQLRTLCAAIEATGRPELKQQLAEALTTSILPTRSG